MERKRSEVSTAIRYSEAFKNQVVCEIAAGKFASINKARRAYGITGGGTIEKWILKYGREDLLPKRVHIETMKEVDELKMARKRIRELEAALADAHIDQCLEHSFLAIGWMWILMSLKKRTR